MSEKAGIKIDPETKEKIRIAAALEDIQHGQLVQRAVDEYVVRHAKELQEGINRARQALLGGRAAALAHLLGESESDVASVIGSDEPLIAQRT